MCCSVCLEVTVLHQGDNAEGDSVERGNAVGGNVEEGTAVMDTDVQDKTPSYYSPLDVTSYRWLRDLHESGPGTPAVTLP